MSPNNEPQNALVVAVQNDETLPAELREEILADYKDSQDEMMAGIDPKFPKIKVAPGGVNNWIIGEGEEAVKTFNGLILANVKANAYWHQKDDNKNAVVMDFCGQEINYNLPLCHSFDGITGSRERVLIPANGKNLGCFGRCSDCYLNEYGTAVNDSGEQGKGKACKNGRRLLVFRDGVEFPYLLTLPPTSIRNFDAYVTMLRGKKKPLWAVWTVFALEKVEVGKVAYSVFKPGAPIDLTANFIAEVYSLRKQFKPQVQVTITEDDFTGTADEETGF